MEDPGGGVPDVKVKSLSPQGKNSYICDPSQLWIAMGGVWVFLSETLSLPLLPIPTLSSTFVMGSVHLVFRFLSKEIILHVVVDLLCQARR